MPITRLPNLQDVITPLIGKPYTENFNCWNFIHLIFTKVFPHITLPTDFFVASEQFIEVWSKFDNLQFLPLIQPYDLILFCNNSPFANHCGIVMNVEKFANCKESTGVAVEYISNHVNEMFQVVRLQHLY